MRDPALPITRPFRTAADDHYKPETDNDPTRANMTYDGTISSTTITASQAVRLERKINASKNRETREGAKAEELRRRICIAQLALDRLVDAEHVAQGNARRAYSRTQRLESGCHECGHPFGLVEHASRWCIMVPGTNRLDDNGEAVPGTEDWLRTDDGFSAHRCDHCHADTMGMTHKAFKAQQRADEEEREAESRRRWDARHPTPHEIA